MRKQKREKIIDFWKSAADIMAALILVLLLILMLFILNFLKNSNDGEYEYSHSIVKEYEDHNIDDEEGNDWHDEEQNNSGGGGGGGTTTPTPTDPESDPGEKGKAAVFVTVIDGETQKTILEKDIDFTLYKHGNQQTLYTYYPVKTAYDDFKTTVQGTFFLPEKIFTGTYYFKEITEPEGYDAADDVYFTIDKDYDWTDPYLVYIPVLPSKNIIKIQMMDEGTNTEISGGIWEVYAAEDIVTADGTKRFSKGDLADTITCDETGYGESKELYLGKYTLKEKEAPFGYAFYKQKEKELSISLKKKSVSQKINVYSSAQTCLSIYLTDEYSKDSIEGAEFKLTSKTDPSENRVFKTDSLGEVRITGLRKSATYTVNQISSKNGYKLFLSNYSFSVSEDGLIDNNTEKRIEPTNRIMRASILIKNTLVPQPFEGEAVSLYKDGKQIDTWTSGKGEYEIFGIDPGEYIIHVAGKEKDIYIDDTASIQKITISIFTQKDIIFISMCIAGVIAIGALSAVIFILLRKGKKKHD